MNPLQVLQHQTMVAENTAKLIMVASGISAKLSKKDSQFLHLRLGHSATVVQTTNAFAWTGRDSTLTDSSSRVELRYEIEPWLLGETLRLPPGLKWQVSLSFDSRNKDSADMMRVKVNGKAQQQSIPIWEAIDSAANSLLGAAINWENQLRQNAKRKTV